ncbi:Amino acid adenylation domain-containing protein [Sulfidibacter corallicola]|uniref:Amino acid adenylation domain-containing protein n=1 Tax=Sulfidibacter corallicola TaxID=2818388 RepID=A0A8A4TMM7_SULCO|nr:non-ribosomal peptide synthetase [Sulfidibacter corallicola]QTD50141.1 amino acid adenylation domain-containing protein [Sulfidibacter corallicola]
MSKEKTDALKNLSLEQLTALRSKLQARKKAKKSGEPKTLRLRRLPRDQRGYPLSFAQESLWFLHQVDPERVDFNLFTSFEIGDAFDRGVFHRALTTVVARHETLRTTFSMEGEQAVQVIGEARVAETPLLDVTGADAPPMADWIQAQMMTPFDLETGPLFRFYAVKERDDLYLLYCFFHHTITDLFSMEIFSRELTECYDAITGGRSPRLPDLPFQYLDFAHYQRLRLQGDELNRLRGYWRNKLGIRPEPLDLRLDQPRPPRTDVRAARETWMLDPALFASLRSLAARSGATLPMLLLTSLAITLAHYSDRQRVLIGTTNANRDLEAVQGIIGYFVNVLVYAIDLEGCGSLRAALARVKETCLGAYEHQALPFAELVHLLELEQGSQRNELTRAMFNYMPYLGNGEEAEITSEALEDAPAESEAEAFDYLTSSYEIAVMVQEWPDTLCVDVEYQTAIFEPETIRAMLSLFRKLVVTLSEDLDRGYADLLPSLPPRTTATPAPAETAPTGNLQWWDREQPQRLEGPALARAVQVLRDDLADREAEVAGAMSVSAELLVAYEATRAAGRTLTLLDPRLPLPVLAERLEAAGVGLVLVRRGEQVTLPEGTATLELAASDWLDRSHKAEVVAAKAVAYVEPVGDDERRLAAWWADVLGLKGRKIGRDHDFFTLGGHSILATQICARIRLHCGVSLPLSDFFTNTKLRDMAACIEGLREDANEAAALPVLDRAEGLGPWPLSFAQQRLWFLDRLEPGSPRYNMPETVSLAADTDLQALEAALGDLVARQSSLRTRFGQRDGQPVQIIDPPRAMALPREDLSDLPPEQRGPTLQKRIDAFAQQPFDLEKGPLFRTKLILGDEDHLLLINMHHIISDGWSQEIFNRELAALYESRLIDRAPNLPALPVAYHDFAQWQRRCLSGGALERRLAFWTVELGGELPILQMPLDRPRPAIQSYNGAIKPFEMPAEVRRALLDMGERADATPFMTLLAVFFVLLHRYSAQTDIIVGSPVAGRDHGGLEHLIGFFVNTLVLRLDLDGQPSFSEVLDRVRTTALAAFDHSDVPFEMLVDKLEVDRDLSRNPVFQVVFNHQRGQAEELAVEGPEANYTIAKFDLTLHVRETPDGIHGGLEYNTDLFDETTAAQLIDHYLFLCRAVVEQPGAMIGRLPMMGTVDCERALQVIHDQVRTFPQEESLIARFQASVARFADQPALIWQPPKTRERLAGPRREMTYGALDRASNRLAHALLANGVRRGDLIAINLPRGLDMVVALLAVLKAGGVYLYLDPAYPEERKRLLLEDAAPRVLIGDGTGMGDIRVVAVDDRSLSTMPETPPDVALSPDDGCYVIYTSGSTGKPKGCRILHRHVGRLFDATQHWFGFDARDTWTLFHSLAFDFSVWELWGALLYGGRLVVVSYEDSRAPAAMLDLLQRERVTVLNQTPSAFRQLAGEEARNRREDLALRYVIFGGEALDLPGLRPWFERHGDAKPRLVNMYGITETTVHVTYRPIGLEDTVAGTGSLIGTAIPDLSLYLLDENLALLPAGVPGELYVGGAGVTGAYLNRPELSAARFLDHPYAGTGKLYRTGDRARRLHHGELEFLGRVDGQIKLRGFRIETGEIEAAIARHPQVAECAVLLIGSGDNAYLAAYYTQTEADRDRAVLDLRAFLGPHLPAYMVPARFVRLERLPLTVHGKLDRRALPKPVDELLSEDTGFAEPRDSLEFELIQILQNIVDHRPIGVHDNFFRVGGNSLLAVKLMNEIERRYDRRLPLTMLYTEGSVAHIAAILRGDRMLKKTDALVTLRGSGSRVPMFWIHPTGGNVFCYIELAHRLGDDQPFYGIQSPSLDGTIETFGSNEATATHYIERIRSVQACGPYRIGGWSSGGVLAYEIARQLHEIGERVEMLMMLDTTAPQAHLPLEDWEVTTSFLIDYYRGDLQLDPRRLKKRSFRENVREISEMAAAKGRYVNTNLPQLAQLFEVFTRDIRSFETYDIKPFDQTIELMIARDSEESKRDPNLGWTEFLPEERIATTIVPGDHFSVLKPPLLENLVETILRLRDTADARRAQRAEAPAAP